jgi:hypothetical protein
MAKPVSSSAVNDAIFLILPRINLSRHTISTMEIILNPAEPGGQFSFLLLGISPRLFCDIVPTGWENA